MRLFEGTPFDRPPRCERCEQVEEDCKCPPEPKHRTPPEKQTARLSVEKRKRGKSVTVVRGLADSDLAWLLKELKSACGAGGAVKDDVIEIQGAQTERVREQLLSLGYRVK
jgi:translation initiation factor 1